ANSRPRAIPAVIVCCRAAFPRHRATAPSAAIRPAAAARTHSTGVASTNHAAIPPANATASHGPRSNPALASQASTLSATLDKRAVFRQGDCCIAASSGSSPSGTVGWRVAITSLDRKRSNMASGSESATDTARPVVTRFAPSPTGFLHIGGARTALFNWLYARRHGGRFVLRIEDTDKVRSTQKAIEAILDGMRWLGLDWDGHEYYQSQFWARHAEVAHELLARGHAYKCWMSQEELAAQREKAQAERRPFRIDSPWRDAASEGEGPFVVRLKAPREGETVIEDEVQGRVAVQNAEIDDFILLRSDGTPTYMLAVVVDDHDMGVTHVVRGDDHLNNAFRQLAIIRGMGWPEPVYAHVPLIHGSDGAKLSKRHGALGVDSYR